jgi:hypothetical protein
MSGKSSSSPAMRSALRVLLALASVCASFQCIAYEAVTNGNFQIGGLAGWTTFTQNGSNLDGGFFVQATSTQAPRNAFVVPAPSSGTVAAMTDQNGPGGYLLYQDIALPANSHPTLTAQIYVQNEADDFHAPATLDYTVIPNQQARFDLVDPTDANLTDVSAPGVLQNFYASQPGDAAMTGYVTINEDLSAYAGQTVRLRFAESDSLQGLLFGVSAVSIQIPTIINITSTPNPVAGQPVQLTATVTGDDPTGTVTFYDGSTILCANVPLTGSGNTRTATCTVTLGPGTHDITTSYSGDSNNPAVSNTGNGTNPGTGSSPTLGVTVSTPPVPAPTSTAAMLLLLAIGLIFIAKMAHRRRRFL